MTAYSPLARGEVLESEVLQRIGAEHGKSSAQVTLRWLLDQPEVCVIPKSASADHRAANLDVFDFDLTREQRAAIHDLDRQHRVIDPSFAPAWGS